MARQSYKPVPSGFLILFFANISNDISSYLQQEMQVKLQTQKFQRLHLPQMPSTPRRIGRIRTDSVWKISVRRKEIAAEIPPLLRAVKNDEEKILKPDSKKQNENNLKACSVIASSSAS